ncbi:MAG: isoprenylcysteine carboxylmethyltransferase family protein [Candidatus Saganbacteria bacterium]|nr:isoprenylcysteine carboxylmethyltransferase family protein [Candidatus Saganbacteria bacterium]
MNTTEDSPLKKIYSRSDQAGRKDLAGEHPLNDPVQVAMIIVFLIVWITDSFFLHMTTSAAAGVPLLLRALCGILLLCLWLYLTKSALNIVFVQTREVPSVIRQGPFAYVRHPIYLGSILLYAGLSIITFSMASFFLTAVAAVWYNYAAAYEEKLLLNKYGKDYSEYMEQVPRWMPRIAQGKKHT